MAPALLLALHSAIPVCEARAAAPTVSTVRIASASAGISGAVVATVAGSGSLTIAPRAAKAWRVEAGKAVLFAVPPAASGESATGAYGWAIQRWDAATRKTATLVSGIAGSLIGFTETTSETGRPIFVLVVADPASGSAAPVPQTLVLHPVLGLIFRRAASKPNLIRYGMVRLETYDTAEAAASASRATGRETQDFDLLVENAKRILPFTGRYTTASEAQAPDGVTVRIRHTLEIAIDGFAALTSVVEAGGDSLPGLPPSGGAAAAPYPLRLTRAFGRIAPVYDSYGDTIRHEGIIRVLPAKAGTPATGVVRLNKLVSPTPTPKDLPADLDATISLIPHDGGGGLTIESWDAVIYGTAPPPLVAASTSSTPAIPETPATADSGSAAAAAPYIGVWKRSFTNEKGNWEETLELNKDLTAKLTTAPGPGAPASATINIQTGTWSIGRENSFRIRFSAMNGVIVAVPDRLTMSIDSGDSTLVGVTFDRAAHGSTMRFTRMGK